MALVNKEKATELAIAWMTQRSAMKVSYEPRMTRDGFILLDGMGIWAQTEKERNITRSWFDYIAMLNRKEK